MVGADRTVTASQLARLLGSWRDAGAANAALAGRIKLLVLDGRLPLRTRLPAERELASALGVSRTTVSAAYERLRSGGFLASRRGAGSWSVVPAGVRRQTGPLSMTSPGEEVLDLAVAALPAPPGKLHAAVEAAVAQLPEHLPTSGYDPTGLPVLRQAVADTYTARGLPTSPEQVLVTNGAQHAWALVLRLLTAPGDRVLVEQPTYPTALVAARAAGVRLVPTAVSGEGWDAGMLEATLRQAAPRVAYLIPDYQNPTGALMDEPARQRLGRALRRTQTVAVADETLVDLRLDGPDPVPPLAAYAPSGLGVSIGSTSKSFWGGLRIGWLRGDADLVARLGAERPAVDLGSPVLEQLAVAHLLADPERVLAPRRQELAARRDVLAALLHERLPQWRFTLPSGGLSLWVDLGAPVSTALAVAASAHGLRLAAGPHFSADGTLERYLRLPYTLPEEALREAVGRLAVVVDDLVPGRAGSALPV